jgi:glucan phosphoethanolaminetransferase (alkaline phosphatase superfamily)
MLAEIGSEITFLFVVAVIICIFIGFYQVFVRLFKETADGIKNHKKNKKQFIISITVICWIVFTILYLTGLI